MDEKYKEFLQGLQQVGSDPKAVMSYLYSNPDYIQYLQEEKAKEENGKKAATNAVTAIDLLKNLGFTAASLSQIHQASKEAGRLNKPGQPQVPGRDPFLQQALYRAQRGAVDPSQTLAPARQEIQDAYRNNLSQAAQASGGQAGAFQSFAQAANTARMRAGLGLAPIAQQTQLQNQQVYNDLLGQRLGETQNMFQNRQAQYNTNLDQYNLESQYAGAAGASGRQNLYKSLQGVADTVSSNPYYLPFSDGIKSYMQKVRANHQQNTSM